MRQELDCFKMCGGINDILYFMYASNDHQEVKVM